MKKLLLIFGIYLYCFTGYAQDCNDLPERFTSYQVALKSVKEADYKLRESLNTENSSWIRGAEFYSCDGETGYLILKTDSNEYIHDGVPVDLWNRFKTASSFGRFYNQYFKGRYRLILK